MSKNDVKLKASVTIYDFMAVKGGAEAVTIDICNHFHEMAIIVGWIDSHNFPTLEKELPRIQTLSQQTSILGWQTIKCSNAFLNKTPDLSQYEVAIYSGSNAPLSILKSRASKNIYYCHTPPRFVYDLKEYYFETISAWKKPLLDMLIYWFKPKYEAAIKEMDIVWCNSKNVQKRLSTFFDIEAEVVYPPVNLKRFHHISDGDYYLSTGRVEEYKRIREIVQAFMLMPDKKLVVASGGSLLEELKALAASCQNIRFTGWVNNEQLTELVGNCKATIYLPRDEDFGMSPVESIAAGKPVIGCREGGLLETVEHGETGWLLPENPTVNDIKDFVEQNDSNIKRVIAPAYLEDRFGLNRFLKRIDHEIN